MVSDNTCVSSNHVTRNLPWPFWHTASPVDPLLSFQPGLVIARESFTLGCVDSEFFSRFPFGFHGG
eukprot:4551199-Amphidinium_carterae.1